MVHIAQHGNWEVFGGKFEHLRDEIVMGLLDEAVPKPESAAINFDTHSTKSSKQNTSQ